MKKIIITTLLILPLMVASAIVLNQSAGILAGEGHARTHDFTVTATSYDLDISDTDTNGERSIKLTVPVKDIDTGIGMRNTHMRTSMFDQKNNPNIIFTANTDAELAVGSVDLNGVLTINGVSKAHVLNITIENNSNDLIASGQTEIILTEFDLPLVGMGPMKILDHVDMAFNIILPKQ
ncbi:MAG: YceI family protein [Fidelibacterota bacterium]